MAQGSIPAWQVELEQLVTRFEHEQGRRAATWDDVWSAVNTAVRLLERSAGPASGG